MTRNAPGGRSTRRVALGLAALPLLACGPAAARRGGGAERLALGPARALGLLPADLPGFHLTEELSPALSAAGLEDPFGRLGAYSATYVQAPPAAGARDEVTSSINTYAGTAHARAAFDTWRAAVPRQYRPAALPGGLPEGDTAAFVRDGTALIGVRVRNVLVSVCAPESRAGQLARLLVTRIERTAG